jgi:DNA topoisomerase-1
MPGLTAKVFRTYNASYTFQEELKKTPEDASVAEKLLAYNRANREVAILCNHQRAAPKTHGNQMMKLKDKVLGYKYERQLVKEQMLELEPSLKKKRPELKEPESDVDDEFIERYLQMQKEKEEQAAQKKLAKENEKRKEEGLEPLEELPETSSRVKKPITDMARLEKKFEQLSDRILASKTNMIDKVSFGVIVLIKV